MDATTQLESIPPLRNAPSGTSAIMRIRTASSKVSRKRRLASSAENPAGSFDTGSGMRQYLPELTVPSARYSNHPPGSNFRTVLKAEYGSGMWFSRKYSFNASGSGG